MGGPGGVVQIDGVVAAVFAGYAFGILWALLRVVLRYPPWKRRLTSG